MAHPKNENTVPKPKIEDVDVSDVPSNRPESTDLGNAIARANELIEQKAAVLADLQAVRQYCTLAITAGNGSRDQVQWVRFYLPRKKRKEKNDAEGSDA